MSLWCSRAELNHRHPDFQSGALPTELQEHINRQLACCIACITLILLLADLQLILSGNQNCCLVPRTGLEPVTYCLEGSCCCPSELSGHKIHCVRLSRFRPGTRQSGQRAQLLYSSLEQKVRVELTNERFAVSYSADECLPHNQGLRTVTASGASL